MAAPGTDAKFTIAPLCPSLLKLLVVLNVPSTPIKLTEFPPVTAVSTTPKAPVVSCLTISPTATVIPALKELKVTFVIAVNTCFEVITGVCGAFVDLCRPVSSNQTTPPELKLPD